MKKYIHVTKEVREHLMKSFGVSGVMVWKALTFESESDLANKIRKAAFGNFGILMTKSAAVETLHDSDDYIRQYLPNDVLLEFSKKKSDSGCDVYHKGVKVRHYDQVLVSDIPAIQSWASTLR